MLKICDLSMNGVRSKNAPCVLPKAPGWLKSRSIILSMAVRIISILITLFLKLIFIADYPAYELFTENLREGVFKPVAYRSSAESPSEWRGRQLRLVVDRSRKVQEVVKIWLFLLPGHRPCHLLHKYRGMLIVAIKNCKVHRCGHNICSWHKI